MAVFAGMLNAMDFHIGRLIEYLKNNGLYEDTIFIITSDNGPEGNDPRDHASCEPGMKHHAGITILKHWVKKIVMFSLELNLHRQWQVQVIFINFICLREA